MPAKEIIAYDSFHDYLLNHENPEWNVIGALYDADTYLRIDELQEHTQNGEETIRTALETLEDERIVENIPYLQRSTGQNDEASEKYAFTRERFGRTPRHQLEQLQDVIEQPDDQLLAVYAFLDELEATPDSVHRFGDLGVPEAVLATRYDLDDVPKTLNPLRRSGVIKQTVYNPEDIKWDENPLWTGEEDVDRPVREAFSGKFYRLNENMYRDMFDSAMDAYEL